MSHRNARPSDVIVPSNTRTCCATDSGQLVIPSHVSVLHVEQEVTGDDTEALQSVLECDTARESLLTEERELNAKINSG